MSGPGSLVLACALLAAPVALAGEAPRAIREGKGIVRGAEAVDGWSFAEVAVDDGTVVRLRVGPADAVATAGLDLRTGDRVRFRYFTGEAPFDVQRIRNETRGEVFRARCLHGEPLGWRGGGGRGPGGPRRGR